MSEVNNSWLSYNFLKKVQAGSGAIFASFLSLHLTTVASASFGPAAFDGALDFFRGYYQKPVIEVAILTSGMVHLLTNTILYVRQRKIQSAAKTVRSPVDESSSSSTWLDVSPNALHRYTGYYLAIFIIGHALATRGLALYTGTPTSFSYIAFSIYSYPLIFYPYYVGLGFSGAYHMTSGLYRAARLFQLKVPSVFSPYRLPYKIALGLFAGVIISSVLALGGLYFPIPTEKFPYYRATFASLGFPGFKE